jgi:hypothetical protein
MHMRIVPVAGPGLAMGFLFAYLTASVGTALATGYELTGLSGQLVTDDNQNSGWPTLENFIVGYDTNPMNGEFPSSFDSNVLFLNQNWQFNASDTAFIDSEGFPGFTTLPDSVTVTFTASSNPSTDSTLDVVAAYPDSWDLLIDLSFPYGFNGVGSFDPTGANSIEITGPADTLIYDVTSAQNDVPEPVSGSLLLLPVAFLARRRARPR